jgi:hypothetical protein
MMAARFSDEDIRVMVEQGVDPPLEESLRKLRAQVSDDLQSEELPSLMQLESADALVATAVHVTQEMAEIAEVYRDAAATFVGRSGEEARAVVSALRDMAAWTDARGAEAQEIAASARRLPDRYLRAFAAAETEPEELLFHAANEFLWFVSKEMDGGDVPEGVDAADAARAEAVDAAARAGGGVGARFVERYVALVEGLRRGATSYIGKAGEEALVEALRRQAASVEAMCKNPDELVAKMVASASWELWWIINQCVSRTARSASASAVTAPTIE